MPKVKKPVKKIAKKPMVKTKGVSSPSSPLSVSVLDTAGKPAGKISLPKELFAAKINKVLMAQAVRVYLSNQREGSASTKTRGKVEGSTRKIYKQKGTGRARHGSIRAPIFVGGGIVFGPTPRDYSLKFPKKMRRAALASALTHTFKEDKMIVVDGLGEVRKTNMMAKFLQNVGVTGASLLVVGNGTEVGVRSARNIANLDIIPASQLHAYTVLSHQKLVFMKEAIGLLQKTFVREAHA